MSILEMVSLYHTSFLPLWISVWIIDSNGLYANNGDYMIEVCTLIISALITILTVPIVIYAFNPSHSRGTHLETLNTASEDKAVITEYLLSCVLPLLAFDFTSSTGIAQFLVFYLILGFLYVKHNYLSANLILELMGYRIYSCTLCGFGNVEHPMKIISKKRLNLHLNQKLTLRSLNNDYCLELSN